jgi:hypothetical protein
VFLTAATIAPCLSKYRPTFGIGERNFWTGHQINPAPFNAAGVVVDGHSDYDGVRGQQLCYEGRIEPMMRDLLSV